jgi:carbon monoxide dehydrogenase subunit G
MNALTIGFALAAVAGSMVGAAASTRAMPDVSVQEAGGAYTVAARFTVAEPDTLVREVLTDYANIPRFMPDVRSSEILHREGGLVRVRQEAVSTYMMFSRRVHLVLDVEEAAGVISFRDRSNESFARYEGAWTITARGEVTEIGYELTAQPAFKVPGFVLRKLLNRDASVMIDRLRAEIAARAVR